MNLIKIIKYVFLGFVQGITEPLPISSSGHILIAKKLFNMKDFTDLNFEIIVNFGSLIAILVIYRKIIISLFKDFFKYIKTKDEKSFNNYKYCWYIVIATIPAGILGLIFKDKIEILSNNIKIIGIALIITGCALFAVRSINGKKSKSEITPKDAVKIGLFQAVALLPGISRSGSTIVGGLLSNLKKEVAVNFSFMLYIPISLATMCLGIKDLIKEPNLSQYLLPYSLAFIVSFIATYFSAKIFINIVKKNKLMYFVYYCLIVGTLVILFL